MEKKLFKKGFFRFLEKLDNNPKWREFNKRLNITTTTIPKLNTTNVIDNNSSNTIHLSEKSFSQQITQQDSLIVIKPQKTFKKQQQLVSTGKNSLKTICRSELLFLVKIRTTQFEHF
jgi:hypothetical protein